MVSGCCFAFPDNEYAVISSPGTISLSFEGDDEVDDDVTPSPSSFKIEYKIKKGDRYIDLSCYIDENAVDGMDEDLDDLYDEIVQMDIVRQVSEMLKMKKGNRRKFKKWVRKINKESEE